MSQYPLDATTGVVDAVNYLLSGPTSIGQNFQGVSKTADPASDIVVGYNYEMLTNAMAAPFFTDLTVTGNNIIPNPNGYWPQLSSIDYYAVTPPGVILPNVEITNITPGPSDVIEVDITVNPIEIIAPMYGNPYFDFTPDGPKNPFVDNQLVTISGVTPSVYNGVYRNSGTFAGPMISTLTLIRVDGVQPWTAYTSGGQVSWQQQNIVTDLFAEVTVTGPTDRVFITCQAPIKGYIFNPVFAVYSPGFDPLTYELRINRYKATNATTLPNGAQAFPFLHNGYEWQLDGNLVTVPYPMFPNNPLTFDDGYSYFQPETTTFNNVIDNPGLGYFLYTFEIYFNNDYYTSDGDPNIQPIAIATYGFRSFTAQVIKQ